MTARAGRSDRWVYVWLVRRLLGTREFFAVMDKPLLGVGSSPPWPPPAHGRD